MNVYLRSIRGKGCWWYVWCSWMQEARRVGIANSETSPIQRCHLSNILELNLKI